MRVRGAALAVSAATAVSAGVTGANRVGALSLSSLASTPQAIGEGKVWLLVTSALIADRPAVPSLLGFWIVGIAALVLCSARVVVGAASLGHVLSALAIYGVIGLVRAVDPHAFASVMRLGDYGLSAIIGAWLGVIASVLWARYPGRLAQVAIVLGSLGCAGIGLALRPDVTFLDTEHLVAFAIGVAVADARVRARFTVPRRRLLTATAAGWSLIGRGS
jgi:hypothetical protein